MTFGTALQSIFVDFTEISGNQQPVHFRPVIFYRRPQIFSGIRHSTVAKDMYCFCHIAFKTTKVFSSTVGYITLPYLDF